MKVGQCAPVEEVKWSYYGAFLSVPSIKDQVMLEVAEFGIDWKRTLSVSSDQESGFLGTFCEEDSWATVLTGEMTLNNGLIYKWYTEQDDEVNILDVVVELIDLSKIDNLFAELA